MSGIEAVHTFMASVENLNTENQRIRATINTLLSQIEDLVELTYSEPADAEMMESINAKIAHGTNGELF